MIRVSAQDVAARYAIAQELDTSIMVEAAAGTGKTTELVRRIVKVLAHGKCRVEQIVAVTFTRKAAGELKLRIRQELDHARTAEQTESARANLEDAMARLEEARIGTIHAFCAEILKERPAQAGVDPRFVEVGDDEGPRLYRAAFMRWFQAQLNNPPQGLRRAMHRKPSWDWRTPMDRLQDAGYKLAQWRDFDASWRRENFPRDRMIDALVRRVWSVANQSAEAQKERDNLYKSLEPTREFSAWVHKTELDRARDYDLLEGRLIELCADLKRDKRKGAGVFSETIPREAMLKERASLIENLEQFARRADADLAAQLRDDLWPVLDHYEQLKARAGKLDFLDLLLKTRDLIRDNAEVRAYLQGRYARIFVDEFQDTDPLQTEILLLLCADDPRIRRWQDVRPTPGKLFVVGDPQQSIYRFRRADIPLYQRVRKALTMRGVKLVRLSRSFRATAPIQSAINASFLGEFREDRSRGQTGYVPLEGGPQPQVETPSIIALPVPHPHGRSKITNQAVEASQPTAIAAFAHWLIEESGWTVRDPEGGEGRVNIRPRHVAILFRRYMSRGSDITQNYVRALEARSVPHVLVGSRSFHQREEVEAIRAALCAIEWPEDELSVFATLRGPLFSIRDDVLLRFRNTFSRIHPFLELPDELEEDFEPIRQALALLQMLSIERNAQPIVETVYAVLDATRAHAGFALRPAGNQVLANVQRICDLARTFELSGGLSFRGFIDRVNEEAEKERSVESPVLEEGTEGVRIMTVHAAKGLEFPVVILADMTATIAHTQPDRTIDVDRRLSATRILGCSPWELFTNQDTERRRDEAEGVRVAYVATTRAKDLLVVPALGEGPSAIFANRGARRSWLAPMERVIYPHPAAFSKAQPAPGCPRTGDTTVLSQPANFPERAQSAVVPGLHRVHRNVPVVWWDPATLDLSPPGTFGLRQEQYLTRDEDGTIAQAGIERYERWRESGAVALEAGERMSALPIRAEEAPLPPPDYDAQIELVHLAQSPQRPEGPRFAALVRASLRDLELSSDDDQALEMVQVYARSIGAPQEEVQAAHEAVCAALHSDVLERARTAELDGRCHREFPVLLETEEGELIDGTLDLVFFEPERGWVAVDYHADVSVAHDRYVRRLQWHLFALEQLTQAPAQGLLLAL